MEEIEIKIDESKIILIPKDKAQQYVDVLNGIVSDCYYNGGFSEGYRNTIAVDLTVCCVMLELDPIKTLDKLVLAKVIEPDRDDENTWTRVHVVSTYHRRFSWDWMIDPEIYKDIGIDYRTVKLPVRFVLA